jgi:class 3 adenylate cyclase
MDRLCDQPDLPRALERCWVTVAFVDLMGFTALCERLQPEETARLLNRFAALVNRLAERRGGALIRLLGDGALVGFGLNGAAHARQADPDPDYGRLARACLAFVLALRQRAAVELAAPSLPGEGIGTRCGVASGYVSLGDWGPPHRLEFTLIGSSVNLAARLQAEAPSNGVLVAEPTAALAGLDLRALRPRVLSLKGFGEVRAVALVDLKSPVTRLAGGPAPYHQQD